MDDLITENAKLPLAETSDERALDANSIIPSLLYPLIGVPVSEGETPLFI
jgi:hypothetical protein